MAEQIKGIRIERSHLPKDAPVEECEKVEEGYVVRFQRRTDVSLGAKFLRIFSDLLNGITKARGTLCNAAEKLPDIIYIKGHALPIKEQSRDSAVGVSSSHEESWPKAFEKIDIFFSVKSNEANSSATRLKDSAAVTTKMSSAPPPPPSRVGRPQLSSNTVAPTVLPPSDEVSEQVSVKLPAPPPRLTPDAVAAITDAPPVAAPLPPTAVPEHELSPTPPAPPLPAESLIKKLPANAAHLSTEAPAPETLNNARQRLRTTKQDTEPRADAAQKRNASDANNLATILQKRLDSMRIATKGDDPSKPDGRASDWDE